MQIKEPGLDSGIYWGVVRHRRFVPKIHRFQYRLMQWCFALDELDAVAEQSSWLSTRDEQRAFLHFKPSDYLRGYYQPETEDFESAVLRKMSELNGARLDGRVFFLGNIRTLGIFFSPLNCYFLQNEQREYTHMLAEVSNTPWNERHYYLVDLARLEDSEKAFHVSPFNPMDMTYQWRLKGPSNRALVHIAAHRQILEFDATMTLERSELNRSEISRVLRTHPVMTLKIVAGIYWQALKLFIKKVPFYSHNKT